MNLLFSKTIKNLMPAGSENFITGWANPGTGGAATVTTGQEDPLGGNTAIRIQLGATQYAQKWRLTVSGRPNPHTDVGSLWMKVLSGNANIQLSGTSANKGTATTEWSKVATTPFQNNSTFSLFDICTNLAADSLDILVWSYPQIEQQSKSSNSRVATGTTKRVFLWIN